MATQNNINNRSNNITINSDGTDAQTTYQIPATQDWSIGIDQSNNNSLTISIGAALGTNASMVISTNGEQNRPLQTAFLATHSVAQNNVTGNNASVTVNYTTVVFDLNNDYDGANLFTAPVTGRYYMYFSVILSQIAGSTEVLFSLISSNRNYSAQWNPSVIANSAGEATLYLNTLADMDAGDTIRGAVQLNGIGANTADFPANVTRSKFFGFLAT